MILWFLKDRRFSVDEAVSKLTKAIIWRQEFGVSELSEEAVRPLAETGKAYVHDFPDIDGRPVLMVVGSKHIPFGIGGRKLHLISWDSIQQEKELGGLGFKNLRSQNKAFIMKLCWGLISKPQALWVRCLRAKYGCLEGKIPEVAGKRNQSEVWRAIITVWNQFRGGVGSKLGNGENTSIWWELWTDLDFPLMNYVEKNLHLIDPEARVNNFVLDNGSWDADKLLSFLPRWVVAKILKLKPPGGTRQDVAEWRMSSDGNFSVKSAYKMIEKQNADVREPIWKHIWKWHIPERAKFFFWQVIHEKIPTNVLRAKRGITDCVECPFECNREESILHILRDCEIANSVWMSLVNPLYYSTFFVDNVQVWLRRNLHSMFGARRFQRWPWQCVFVMTCWLLWKNRCRHIFEGKGENTKKIVNQISHLLREGVVDNVYKHEIFCLRNREAATWFPPPQGYVRMDVDGSVYARESAACGGIIRDHASEWRGGFQVKLGPAVSSTAAEILAIKSGLLVCKQLGLSRIKLFSDSLQALQLLLLGYDQEHPLAEEIEETRSIIFSDWDLEIFHEFRDVLKCADMIAKDAHRANNELRILQVQPAFCSIQMLADKG